MRKLGIQTLECRRTANDLTFLFRIINGFICSPSLISQINFNAPERAIRQTLLFRPLDYTSRFSNTDPMNRICNLDNLYCGDVDFFNGSPSTFKKSVYRAIVL